MNIFEKIAEAEREGLSVLVIGGHAVNAYGYTRTTLDVDFLVAVESFPEWRRVFESAGYRWVGQTETFANMDLPDILNLVSICQIDTESGEFVEVLNRYASDETRSLLDSHLR